MATFLAVFPSMSYILQHQQELVFNEIRGKTLGLDWAVQVLSLRDSCASHSGGTRIYIVGIDLGKQ